MTRLWLGILLLLIAFSLPAAAQPLETGLYRVVDEGAGVIKPRVDHPNAGDVCLGERITDTFRGARMRSYDNANTLFGLELTVAGLQEGDEQGYFALVIAGRCMRVHSRAERQPDGSMYVSCTIAGTDNADAVAEELGLISPRREHPGHRMLVTVAPTQERFVAGSDVILEMRIENVGNTPIRFYDGGQQRGARNNQFGFTAFDMNNRPVPDIGDPMNFGGLAGRIDLAPGEVFTKRVVLNGWFNFDQPGAVFSITAMYQMQLLDERNEAVWDDFAVARCGVVITEE